MWVLLDSNQRPLRCRRSPTDTLQRYRQIRSISLVFANFSPFQTFPPAFPPCSQCAHLSVFFFVRCGHFVGQLFLPTSHIVGILWELLFKRHYELFGVRRVNTKKATPRKGWLHTRRTTTTSFAMTNKDSLILPQCHEAPPSP